jgi:large subunit ribosomal protein L13
VPTWSPKPADVSRAWHVVDAEGLVLGRLATEVARLLRGKHKPTFAPHMDMGDHVVIVNAAKVVLTADKAVDKMIYRHTGYPGGLKETRTSDMMSSRPEEVVRKAVKGMLPKGTLGRQMGAKLKVYAGAEHPHSAQQPMPFKIEHARYRAGAHAAETA